MNLSFFEVVSVIWILSEIVLARTTYSAKKNDLALDRSSLRNIWITIFLSVNIGIIFSITGVGYIPKVAAFFYQFGLGLVLFGLAVRWAAILTLRRYFTPNVSIKIDHQLVIHGIYRYIRHPSYTGSLLSFLGLSLSFSNWLVMPVIFIPILIAFLHRIKIEEDAMRNHFGQFYDQYCESTFRLVPKIY